MWFLIGCLEVFAGAWMELIFLAFPDDRALLLKIGARSPWPFNL